VHKGSSHPNRNERFSIDANAAVSPQVELTPLEFRVLSALVRHPGQVLSPDQLLEHAWGGADRASRDQVKLYVGYLRRKLGPDTASRIETRRGFGYRYRAESAR
jgi:DNA-binding response OmpR family regulator